MFAGLKTSLERIVGKLTELSIAPKKIMKAGFLLFILIFAAGTFIVISNRYFFPYDSYFDFIGNQLVKNSFSVLAEFVVCAVGMDFVFGKSK
jgi:hypothetical protein